MKTNHPILIVGAGLSGLSVAIRLIEKGRSVVVFDNGVNHSSRVAAGMINPLVFRRMTKSWRLDESMAALEEFYKDLEKKTGVTFMKNITIRRLFSSQQERELWLKKQDQEAFQSYMERTTPEDDSYSGAINRFGSGRVKKTSYIETAPFLTAAKSYVSEHGELRNETFDSNALSGNDYKGLSFESVIFCEGYTNISNPFFGHLPVEQTKGETLTIQSSSLPENESINRKCFVLPLGENHFRIGSTYEWHTPDLSSTEAGKELILSNLSHLTEESVTVVDQHVGIRPTTRDRRPIIGKHPEHPNYFIFNGLGAKGYMLAPLLSSEFVDYLLDGSPLHPEVDISRIKPKD